MGQSMDVLSTCDGTHGQAKAKHHQAPGQRDTPGQRGSEWNEDVSVSCAALEDGVKSVVASANRGGARISDEVLLNHELLQYSRQGNFRGVSEALDKGAWTETRRPLVMKPQKPDAGGKKNKGGSAPPGKDDEATNVGMTPIMFSSQKGAADCVQRLLAAKAEVNAVEEDGWSALHFAAKEGHYHVCQLLLEGGADPTMLNIDDQSALDVADKDCNFEQKLKGLISEIKDSRP
mmetsp:Transcript_100490/g.181342  ORF Transcript_100490/g.181342 Transcript_100490/m.181342 type:complete len:233 (-) Transcript_100490:196-894(-)|eukprot:CAMPEP_0115055668 /NCGR_PEP_ID=MMETSP0227-20121206/4775_1 /TAXON_ID=89957 /ORGANISM="Polarella glacialis, Strain CCMP 1383" /LENGTH=232 /DNA_ID=CAMNT_0002440275 /DNA_START=76 /DNA_END=774 /DNA_ORIENTATION=+